MGNIDLALLLIRVAAGLAFLYHGSGILLGAFGGPGPQAFASMEHMPLVMAYLVGLIQVGGGIAVLLGIFARIGALCLVIVMLGAIFLVHAPHGYDINKGGYEYALTQMLIALGLFVSGPGAYALSANLPPSIARL
jgi:putative oxidoreductase